MHSLRFWILEMTKRRNPLPRLGFQRFLPSDIFDYFALMSDLSKSLENRLPNRHGGSNLSVSPRGARSPVAERKIFVRDEYPSPKLNPEVFYLFYIDIFPCVCYNCFKSGTAPITTNRRLSLQQRG